VFDYYQEALERGLIDGACGFCANFFEVDDEVEAAGIALDGGADEHGPDIAGLVEDGYQIINVG